MLRRSLTISFTALALGACAGPSTLPVSVVAPPQANVDATVALHAEANPRVALHLKFARDQMRVAEKLLHEGNRHAAELALICADADARLALALAREDRAESEARDVQTRLADLRARME